MIKNKMTDRIKKINELHTQMGVNTVSAVTMAGG